MRDPDPTRVRAPRRAATVLGLALVLTLAGCSRHTAYTVSADLVPFMSQSQTHASFSYLAGSIDIQLPVTTTPPNPGQLVDLSQLGVPSGATSAIDAVALDMAADIAPTTTIDPGTASVYVAPSTASDAFQSSYLVGSFATPSLPGGQTTTVSGSVRLDGQTNSAALQRVQSGAFRLGVEVKASAASGGSADITLTRLVVSLSLPPGWGLP